MITYNSTYEYLNSSVDLLAQITRMKAIILAYENALLSSATTAHILEYSLDDGQSKIKTGYRSVAEFTSGLVALDALLQRLVVRYNKQKSGSVYRVMDSKNFKNYF